MRRGPVERWNDDTMSMLIASLEAIKFPTSRKYEVLMLPQFSSSWPFVGVHSETALTKVIRLRGQINILWQWRADFCLVQLRKGIQR